MSLGNNMILASGAVIEPENVSVPVVTGTVETGQTLTGTDGAWNTSGNFTYQWQRGGGSSWSNIGGATSNSYTLTSSDNGEFVRCAVTLTNDAGTATAFTNTSNVKPGQATYTQTSGTYSWTCPGGVTSVSIMAIGKGGNGYSACNNVTAGTGGRGGALSYTNNYSVTPGTTYYIHIQAYQGAPHYANISGFSTSSTNNNTNAFVVAAQPGENGTGGGDASKGFGNTKYSGGTCYGNQGGGGGASGYSGNGGSQPSGTNHAETTGNGHVNGYFSSNYLVANTQLRGGTTSASANLIIGSATHPGANLTLDMGTTTMAWGNVYANNLRAFGDVEANYTLSLIHI